MWRRWASAVTTRQGDLQQAWLASQQLQGPEPGQLKLIDGVTGWQVYFWRGQGWSNAQSSGTVVAVAGAGGAAVPGGAASGAASGDNTGPGAAAAAEAATASASAASGAAAAGTVPGAGGGPATPTTVTQRVLLPTGVRLQLDLPEGRLLRDVLLSPQS